MACGTALRKLFPIFLTLASQPLQGSLLLIVAQKMPVGLRSVPVGKEECQ